MTLVTVVSLSLQSVALLYLHVFLSGFDPSLQMAGAQDRFDPAFTS